MTAMYALPLPTSVRRMVIDGQTVSVYTYPAGARRKAVTQDRSFTDAVDGTRDTAIGRALVAADYRRHHATSVFASPGKLGRVTVNGRTSSGGMRQSAYSSPLAPVRAGDGLYSGFGGNHGLEYLGRFDDRQSTLFDACAAIATRAGHSSPQRNAYADGSRVTYHGSGQAKRPSRAILEPTGGVTVRGGRKPWQWPPRKRRNQEMPTYTT